jgi:MYXO-CTERM domain-containing protein
VTGTDFEDGATVQVDGVDHVAVVVDTSSLTFETTPHDEGIAQVVVVNPSGALATRDGGLQFMDPPTWPPEDSPAPDSADTGDTGDSGLVGSKDSTSINCSSRPAAPSAAWAVLALLLGLRRRQ